jgi:transposase
MLKSPVLVVLYSIRSEQQFCEQLDDNVLFRWLLDMNMVEESFDPKVFTQNRERLMEHEVWGSGSSMPWSRRLVKRDC